MISVISRAFSFKFNRLILVLLGSLALPALAQQKSLTDCQNISDRNARFACYDQAESAKPTVPAGATQSTIPAKLPQAQTTVVAPSQDNKADAATSSSSAKVSTVPADKAEQPFYRKLWPFGHDENSAAQTSKPAVASKPLTGNAVDDFGRQAKVSTGGDGVKELEDTVASLKLIQYDMYKITLGSGQVWQQSESKRYLLKPGDKIKIRPTSWGDSYRLYSDRLGSYIQVDRVD